MKSNRIAIVAGMFLATLFNALICEAITTSGPLTGSETWSGTVRLTGDVTVTPTGSLTILPGTRIESDPRADDQVGGIHTSRIELIVDQGVLVAAGTPISPIQFTAAMLGTNAPQPGDWYGVRINSTNVTVRQCTVEYAKVGLSVEGGTPAVDHCTFRKNDGNGVRLAVSATLSDCTLNENGTGISVFSGATLTLSSSRINNNTGNGIWVTGTYPAQPGAITVTSCTISNNGGSGVVGANTDPYGLSMVAMTITDTTILGNANGVAGSGIVSVTMTSSTVAGNRGHGIDGWGVGNFTLNMTNCTVDRNTGDGIHQGGNTTGALISSSSVSANGGNGVVFGGESRFTDSAFLNNAGAGIVFSSLATNGFSGNVIYGNSVGVQVNSAGATVTGISGNDIFGNWQYELKNNGSAAVVADGNYWGEPTTTELSNHVSNLTKIYDSRDDASVGQVVIHNWSATMLHEAPPSIVSQPQGQLGTPGVNVRFDVAAVGSPPLAYQWWKDASTIEGATNASLVLTNVQASAAGNYWVAVSNSLGSTNSAAAILTVDQSALGGVLSLNMYAGMVFSGTVGKPYSIQYLDDLSRSNNWFDWTPLTNFTLQASPASFIDWNSPGASKRFYRAVQMP